MIKTLPSLKVMSEYDGSTLQDARVQPAMWLRHSRFCQTLYCMGGGRGESMHCLAGGPSKRKEKTFFMVLFISDVLKHNIE